MKGLLGWSLPTLACNAPTATPLKNTPYHLRPRAQNFELPVANNNLKKNLFIEC